jgi:Spy/CpxP family protein refolding chaperone
MILTMMLAAMTAAIPAAAQPAPSEASQRGGSRLDYLAGFLSLTDTQKTQAASIFEAAASATSTARGQLDAARSALSDAWKANRADAEIDRLGAALGAIEGQIAAINAKAQAKFYALLTAEQKAKYDAMGSRIPRGPGPGFGGR